MKEFTNLDKLDRKILFELDLNSRIPTTKLAKKLKVSREVVDYRIKRLTDNKYIRTFAEEVIPEFS
ncbi:MAG: winged helix-turn-helix transcriptional regulator [Thaumarchaeota archaeon]|nr:winged helix-turn-helix transcriptional regulator [Nitrososphaerota archaeon]